MVFVILLIFAGIILFGLVLYYPTLALIVGILGLILSPIRYLRVSMLHGEVIGRHNARRRKIDYAIQEDERVNGHSIREIYSLALKYKKKLMSKQECGLRYWTGSGIDERVEQAKKFKARMNQSAWIFTKPLCFGEDIFTWVRLNPVAFDSNVHMFNFKKLDEACWIQRDYNIESYGLEKVTEQLLWEYTYQNGWYFYEHCIDKTDENFKWYGDYDSNGRLIRQTFNSKNIAEFYNKINLNEIPVYHICKLSQFKENKDLEGNQNIEILDYNINGFGIIKTKNFLPELKNSFMVHQEWIGEYKGNAFFPYRYALEKVLYPTKNCPELRIKWDTLLRKRGVYEPCFTSEETAYMALLNIIVPLYDIFDNGYTHFLEKEVSKIG